MSCEATPLGAGGGTGEFVDDEDDDDDDGHGATWSCHVAWKGHQDGNRRKVIPIGAPCVAVCLLLIWIFLGVARLLR